MILLPRIIQGRFRMGKAVKIFPALFMGMMMPVIQEIVMEQRPSDDVPLFAADPHLLQLFPDIQAAFRHTDTVAVHRHGSMLHIPARVLKIGRMQNIPSVFAYAFPDSPASFQPSALLFQLPE